MKVTITKRTELEHPRLEISVFLESGQTRIELKHDCAACGGYGCVGGKCNNTIFLKEDEVLDTLGAEGKAVLETAFRRILGEEAATPAAPAPAKTYLVTPRGTMTNSAFFTMMESIDSADVRLVNTLKMSGVAIVEATPVGVKQLQHFDLDVKPNGIKRATEE